MARESTISDEQVATICNQMVLDGAKPTSRSVREALGNTGSMGTINKMISAWKAGQVRTVASALVLPATIQKTILDFMDRELASAKSVLLAELVEQQQESSDLATENERLLAETVNLAEDLETVRASLATQEGRAAQLTSDLTAAREQAERERQVAAEVKTELTKALMKIESLPALQSELADLKAMFDVERKARVAAEQSVAVLSAQKAILEDRVPKLESELHSTRERAEKLHGELGDERVRVQATQARLESAHRDMLEANKEMSSERENSRRLGEVAAELKGELAAIKKDKKDGVDK